MIYPIVSFSQEITVTPLPNLNPTQQNPEQSIIDKLENEVIDEQDNEAIGETGTGALLRALDRVSGETLDIELLNGQETFFFDLIVKMNECRFPQGDLASDAFAYLMIRNVDETVSLFSAWMIASSPTLSALDHPRYDIWVIRCTNS
ncbi:MAG: DUF2155 domain-containing protein [Aestuariivita sp.]|nr:DUF2155 domain-containing protein [Aestuariivita sp.]